MHMLKVLNSRDLVKHMRTPSSYFCRVVPVHRVHKLPIFMRNVEKASHFGNNPNAPQTKNDDASQRKTLAA